KNQLIKSGDKIIAAYSGGIDSSVLVYLFDKFCHELDIQLIAAYFNHGLRDQESIKEEEFIKRTADRYKCQLEIGTGNVIETSVRNRSSIQESARTLRYEFLNNVVKKHKGDIIATAHQYDDQVETVLMRLLQGCNLNGLKGIPVKRGNIIRPLLWAKKEQLENFAENNKIEYFEDSSNKKKVYVRNLIRLDILPYLKNKLDTNLDKILYDHGKMFDEVNHTISLYTKSAFDSVLISKEKDKIILDISSFKVYFTLLQQNIIFKCFENIGATEYKEIELFSKKVVDFVNNDGKKKHLNLSTEFSVYIDGSELVLLRTGRNEFRFDLRIDEKFHFPEIGIDLELNSLKILDEMSLEESISRFKKKYDEVIDKNKVKEPLILRTWKKGDFFQPLGMRNNRKLSDFFIDQKIPEPLKRTIPIICDEEKIVCICGLRINERVRITNNTKEILGLKITPKK
ncbi:tRNA lysidine(34) synthetase TilS, partial [candidate division KSB1 bacterium]